jgi:competence protein ComGC
LQYTNLSQKNINGRNIRRLQWKKTPRSPISILIHIFLPTDAKYNPKYEKAKPIETLIWVISCTENKIKIYNTDKTTELSSLVNRYSFKKTEINAEENKKTKKDENKNLIAIENRTNPNSNLPSYPILTLLKNNKY